MTTRTIFLILLLTIFIYTAAAQMKTNKPRAIINAMVAAETMTGVNGNTVYAIPHDRLKDALRKYNRLIR